MTTESSSTGRAGPGGTGAVCENTIQGNYVGLDPSGLARRAKVDDGIDLDRGSCNNLIGSSVAGAANIVAGNSNDGIDLHERNANGAGTNGNRILGNIVGLATDGMTAVKNLQHGVHLHFTSQANIVDANVVAASGLSGIAIEHPSARSNTVRGNLIGVAVNGTTVRGNETGRLAGQDPLQASRPNQTGRPRSGRGVEVEKAFSSRGSGVVSPRSDLHRRDVQERRETYILQGGPR